MKTRYPLDSEDQQQAEAVESALSEGLTPIQPDLQQRARMHARLFSRVQNSLAAESTRITVRHDEGHWRNIRPGVRAKTLSKDHRAFILDLAPGASLPMHRHHENEECVVLHGSADLDELTVHAGDYHLAHSGSRHGRISSTIGALLYLRGIPIGHNKEVARDLLTAFLPGKGRDHITIRAQEGVWSALAPGIWHKSLLCEGNSHSSMIRMKPQAVWQNSAEILAQDEEYLLLNGDMFVGDTLLREGDWQFAPKGSKHLPLTTQHEALLFVRNVSG